MERGVSFEKAVSLIEGNDILAVVDGAGKFSHQKQYILDIDGYAYIVPFVLDGDAVFLKTIIPSRKMTKRYLGRSR